MSTDDFTRDRLAWLERLAFDTEISCGAARLALVLATSFLNRQSGDAWPSQETLAEILGLKSERQVGRLVKELVDAGYLERRKGGRGKTNHYRMGRLDQTPDVRSTSADDRTQHVRSSEFERTPDVRSKEADQTPDVRSKEADQTPDVRSNDAHEVLTGHSGALDQTFCGTLTRHPVSAKPSEEPFEEPFEKDSRSKPPKASKVDHQLKTQIDGEFVGFWKQYPKRVARGAAKKAFERIVKSGKATGMELVKGAMRYAAAVEGTDAKYIKHPATWLNGECWLDEPEPPQQQGSQTDRGRRGLAEIAMTIGWRPEE